MKQNDIVKEFTKRAEACRNILKGMPSPIDSATSARLKAKETTYRHCAELLAQWLERE